MALSVQQWRNNRHDDLAERCFLSIDKMRNVPFQRVPSTIDSKKASEIDVTCELFSCVSAERNIFEVSMYLTDVP